jgi:hypothetical protein
MTMICKRHNNKGYARPSSIVHWSMGPEKHRQSRQRDDTTSSQWISSISQANSEFESFAVKRFP